MVVRAWRGYAATAEAQAYPKHLLQSVRPKLDQLAGFRGLYLLRRRGLDEVEFLVLTLWDSMDAVRALCRRSAGASGRGTRGTRRTPAV